MVEKLGRLIVEIEMQGCDSGELYTSQHKNEIVNMRPLIKKNTEKAFYAKDS